MYLYIVTGDILQRIWMQRQTNGRIIIDILQLHLNTLNAVFENMSRALELDIQRLRLGVIKKSSDSY